MLTLEVKVKQVRQYDARRADSIAERRGSGRQYRGPPKFRFFCGNPGQTLQTCSGLARVVDDIRQLKGFLEQFCCPIGLAMPPPSNSQRPQSILAIHRFAAGLREGKRFLLPEQGPADLAAELEAPAEQYHHRGPQSGV